jgi:hypothetical protein
MKELDIFLMSPICYYCQHSNGRTCSAFPTRIPDEILDGEYDHRYPFPGDNGIRFQLLEGWELPDWVDEHYSYFEHY